MHEFTVRVEWDDTDNAKMTAADAPALATNAPAEFGGPGGVWSPEDMFVGSIVSCTMLTLLYFAEKMKIGIAAYRGEGTGVLRKGAAGFEFAKVMVKAAVQLEDEDQAEKAKKLGEKAEKYCLVSNSLKCPVTFSLEIEGA